MSIQNPGNRRAVLWNVQQPGDPYDIRKSMIAKLPQHPPRFMGDNLQLVCLFQAAQIQRLAQFLNQMTLQMRSVERTQLDRHSYQIQIKQLAQKLQLSHEYKTENSKLRQFIKGQSQQLQNLQRYRNSAQSIIQLQTKYQNVLNELRLSRDNYEALRKTNTQTLTQIAEVKFRYQRLQMTLSQERSSKQRQIKFAIQKALLQTKSLYESREYQLKGQITVMKENLMLKNQQITIEKQKNSQLYKQLNQKQEIIGKYTRGQIEIQSSNKTQQFLRISKRLQQSTYLLQQKQKSIINYKDEITYLNKRTKQLQQDLRKKQLQLKSKQQQYNNSPQLLIKIAQFDKKITVFSSQIERLKEVISIRQREINQTQKQLVFYKDKGFVYQKNIQALHRDLQQRQSIIKRLQFDVKLVDNKDAKLQALGNQVSRLNVILREKLNQLSRLQLKINQFTQTETHHITLLRAKDQAISILQAKTRQYEMRLNSNEQVNKLNFDQINRLNLKVTTLENQNINYRREIDSKAQSSSSELTQLRLQVTNLTQEINDKIVENKMLREDNQNMFAQINQFERTRTTYQSTTNQLRLSLNQQLIQKDRYIEQITLQFRDKQRAYLQKLDMYTKSVPKMSTEIDRLHQLLQKRSLQIKRIQQDLDIQREKNRMIERRNSTQIEMRILDYERNISFYESKIKNYQKLNSQLVEQKNKVSEKIQSLESKLRESHMELDKIMSALKVKQTSFQEYQKRTTILQSTINQLRQQNLRLQSEGLKSRQQLQLNMDMIKKIQYDFDLCKRDLSKGRNDYSGLMDEYNRLRSAYEQKQSANPQLMHTIDELKHKLAKCDNQIQHLSNQLNERKRRAQMTEEQSRQLKVKLSEYQQSIKHTQQVNVIRLQQMRQRMLQQFQVHLKKQTTRYSQLQQAYNQLQLNYQDNSRYFQDHEDRVHSLQQQNIQLRQHLQQYQQKVFSYQQRIALISQQIQRLTMENNQLKNRIQKMERDQSEHRAFGQINSELERTRTELTNLKAMLQQYQSINKHTISERDQLFRITHQQQEKITQYLSQINRLNAQLNSLKSTQSNPQQLQLVKQQYSLIYNQFSSLQVEYNHLITQLQMTRKRITQLSTSSTKQKDFQVRQLQIKIHKITEQYQTALRIQRQQLVQSQQNMEKQSRAITILQTQNNSFRSRINQLQNKIASEQQIQTQIEQLKTAYINIKLQNQELNRMLQQMQEQLFDANQEKKRISTQHNQQLLQENNNLRITIQQERRVLQTLRQKLSLLSTQIDQTRSQAQYKIQSLNSSCISLGEQNITLKQQIESLQIQITQISVYQQISAELQLKYNNLYQAYEQTYKVYNQIKIESQTVKENLNKAQFKINLLNQQFEKINSLLLQLRNQSLLVKSQNETLKRQWNLRQTEINNIIISNQDLQKELKRIYQLNQDLTEQLKQIRLRLTDQHALQQKIKHHMFLFVMLCAQIDSLRKRVQQTEQQCEQVKRSSISPIKTKK